MPLFALYQLWVLVLQPYLSAPRLQAGPCLVSALLLLLHVLLASSALGLLIAVCPCFLSSPRLLGLVSMPERAQCVGRHSHSHYVPRSLWFEVT